MSLCSDDDYNSQFDPSSDYESPGSHEVSYETEPDYVFPLSSVEVSQRRDVSYPTNLLLPTISSSSHVANTAQEGPINSFEYWQTEFSGSPDLSSLVPIYDPSELSNWHPQPTQRARKHKKSKKAGQKKRERTNYLIEERNWIDQKYRCLSRLYPNLRINQIAKMIHDELYVMPLVDIGDSEVRSIRKLIARFSSHGADRQYQSVLFHLYNIRKQK